MRRGRSAARARGGRSHHLRRRRADLSSALVAAGAPEGDRSRPPPLPDFASGWQLGVPDLIVRLPEPYPLVARGREVFRNFVLPVPISGRRWVRAVEFGPRRRRDRRARTILRLRPSDAEATGALKTITARRRPR